MIAWCSMKYSLVSCRVSSELSKTESRLEFLTMVEEQTMFLDATLRGVNTIIDAKRARKDAFTQTGKRGTQIFIN